MDDDEEKKWKDFLKELENNTKKTEEEIEKTSEKKLIEINDAIAKTKILAIYKKGKKLTIDMYKDADPYEVLGILDVYTRRLRKKLTERLGDDKSWQGYDEE